MKFILITFLASTCFLVGCFDNNQQDNSQGRYLITLFGQEVLDDGTLSYSRTYETTNLKYKSRFWIEFDNITFTGSYLIEKIN